MLSLSVEVSIFSRALHVYLALLAIAGLSAALGLAMSGHKVRVLERDTQLEKAPGGVRLPPNVTKILVQWGLEEEIAKRGSLVREGTNIWDCTLSTRRLGWSLSAPVILLIVHLVETGELLGYLEWADPLIQDSGAKFYMMRVGPKSSSQRCFTHLHDHSMMTCEKFCIMLR
jgi:hypothetical protein